MRKKIHIFLLSMLLLTSCTAYVDTRREAGAVKNIGQSTKQTVALCYNPMFEDENELQQLAEQACLPKKAVYKDKKYFNCTLFYPNTAFYECK